MALQVHTARMGYRADDEWLDVTRGGNFRRIEGGELGGHRGIGVAFAPSAGLLRTFKDKTARTLALTDRDWLDYTNRFKREMRSSYGIRRQAWDELLALPRVVLICFCSDPTRCHRTILASDILPKLGAIYRGEIA